VFEHDRCRSILAAGQRTDGFVVEVPILALIGAFVPTGLPTEAIISPGILPINACRKSALVTVEGLLGFSRPSR
jgi:hypothetical protein